MAPVKPSPVHVRGVKPTRLSSGNRGAPVSGLFARAEKKYPGIEERVGLSSAALRAGELVRGMRKAKGWTQTQLADLLGWDQVRISNIERGEGTRGPTFDVLTKIADACGYDFQFTPREARVTAAKPAPLRNPIGAELGGYAGIIGRAIDKLGGLVTPVRHPEPEPQFLYACSAFVNGIGENAPVHAEIVEGVIEPFTDWAAYTDKAGVAGVPFIEVTGHGQRMVMVPFAVEPAPATDAVSFEVEVKFFPNRLPDVS